MSLNSEAWHPSRVIRHHSSVSDPGAFLKSYWPGPTKADLFEVASDLDAYRREEGWLAEVKPQAADRTSQGSRERDANAQRLLLSATAKGRSGKALAVAMGVGGKLDRGLSQSGSPGL